MARSLAPDAGLADTLHWALAHACAAPSELNSQPWRFSVDRTAVGSEAVVELTLDPARRLPAVDADGREAHLACGAALLNLQLALTGAQVATSVTLCPDPAVPALLARIEVGGHVREAEEDVAVRLAIPERATHRGSFEAADLPGSDIVHLVAAAAREGALVAVLTGEDLEAFEALSAAAQESLWADGAYRREVAQWTTSNHGQRADGVPGSAYGLTDWRAPIEPLLVRLGSSPKAPGDRDATAALHSPLVLVIGSAEDTPTSWLRAGAGMQRLLLAACSTGISASFLNAALHAPGGRVVLGRISGLDHPQVVLRVGYGHIEPVTPRRLAFVV